MNLSAHSVPNRDLKQVLHHFQLYAMNALGGPSLWNAEMAKLAGARFQSYKAAMESLRATNDAPPPHLPVDFKIPVQPKPILLRADTGCEQSESVLEGKKITCFNIGGERRLCLPQLLQTVLGKLALEHIDNACDDLNIYCSRCSPEQLDLFKRTGYLPSSARSCGLITLTDAERLCGVLLHSANDSQNNYIISDSTTAKLRASISCIPVYHECFGEGRGFLKPELYSSADAMCIECADCGELLSTKRFVGHSHGSQENLTCHWGFDRDSWKSYVLLDEDAIDDKELCTKLQLVFDETVQMFSGNHSPDQSRKRKAEIFSSIKEEETAKSRRFSDSEVAANRVSQSAWLPSPPLTFPPRTGWPGVSMAASPATQADNSISVKTEPRLLSQRSCPPTLENPDRVVPSCESDRYGKHFVPNIALQQSNETENDDTSIDKAEQDADSKSSDDSGGLNTSDKSDASDDGIPFSVESHTYRTVLENLAKMENQYLQLLHCTVMSRCEKDKMQQKYVSYSDSIRKQFTPKESCDLYKEEDAEVET